MKPTDPSETFITTSVRMDRDVWARFCEIAAAEHRTAAGEFRRMIAARVAEADAVDERQAA